MVALQDQSVKPAVVQKKSQRSYLKKTDEDTSEGEITRVAPRKVNKRIAKSSHEEFDGHRIDLEAYTGATLERQLQWYGQLLAIRRFEERAGQLYGMGKIGGFCHLYIGQEAVVTGMKSAAKPQDAFITGYRDHGHMLACGMDPRGVMAELTGRANGYSRGKGGSMHMFSSKARFFGGHGIVGTQVSLGTGIAMGYKYLKEDALCFTFFGDGAFNQGQVFESFNMASLWGLPVVYVLENNRYGMGTSVERSSAQSENLIERSRGFGIASEVVDGMDVEAVYACARRAVAYVRQHMAPVLIEARTYRYRGHSMSDPGQYRTRVEIDSYRKERDPILLLRDAVIKRDASQEAALAEIDAQARKMASAAAEAAVSDPFPEASELHTDVYAA